MARVRILGVLAALMASGLLLPSSAPPTGRTGNPTTFAAVADGRHHMSLELRSAVTGRVVRTLGRLGGAWTDNGFALAPDGRHIYLTLIPRGRGWRSLKLEQVSTSTGRRRLVARGEQPAFGPDGRLLAYASGEGATAAIVVRDLATGRSRHVTISAQLGARSDLLNAQLAWFRGGHELAVFEFCCAVAVSADRRARSPQPGRRLIVVSVPGRGDLTARRIVLPPDSQLPYSVGTDASHPRSLLVTWPIRGDRSAVLRLTVGPTHATLRRLVTIAHALVLGFDPTGGRLLYLLGHRPPNLWTATIVQHSLLRSHLLIRRSQLGPLAW